MHCKRFTYVLEILQGAAKVSLIRCNSYLMTPGSYKSTQSQTWMKKFHMVNQTDRVWHRHFYCNAPINTLFLLNGKWTVVLLRSGTETYNVSDAEDRVGVSARGYLSRQPAKVAGRFSQIVSGCETMNSPSPPLCLKTNPTGLSLPPQGS